MPAPPARREPASFLSVIPPSGAAGTYLKASQTAVEGVGTGRRGEPGCRRLRPGVRAWAAHSRKSGVIAALAGVQAVSGCVFLNSRGAPRFREGRGGRPMVPTDLTKYRKLPGEVTSPPTVCWPLAVSTSQAAPSRTGRARDHLHRGGLAGALQAPGPALRKSLGGVSSFSLCEWLRNCAGGRSS